MGLRRRSYSHPSSVLKSGGGLKRGEQSPSQTFPMFDSEHKRQNVPLRGEIKVLSRAFFAFMRHLVTFREGPIFVAYGCSKCHWQFRPKVDTVPITTMLGQEIAFMQAQIAFERHD